MPLALDNARENADLNAVSKALSFSTTPVAQVRGKFDLVVANILSKTLIAMAPDLKRLVASGGHLVLGGILAREAKSIASHYAPELQPRQHHGFARLDHDGIRARSVTR